ncbi:MAG: hypothetical protein ACMXYG_03020 [Candidatus Woesearchaeota archaeon]
MELTLEERANSEIIALPRTNFQGQLSGNFRDVIATLGPSGTDSENVAKQLIQQQVAREIVLCKSFRESLEYARKNNTYLLIPAAYIDKDDQGKLCDSWGRMHFELMDEFKIKDVFERPLQELCIAKKRDVINPNSIIIHPATENFVDRYVDSKVRRYYSKSKPEAVQRCSLENFDMCIGSVPVVEQFANLEIIKRFSPTMVWILYQQR